MTNYTPETVTAYMRLAEQRIGAAFVADGLCCHLAGGWQGPHTLTFALRLYEPTAGNVAKAGRLAGALEAAVGVGPVRVYAERGAVFVEIPNPWPVTVPGSELRGNRLAVPLGLSPRRVILGVDFASTPHLLVIGPTGRGKTTAMRALAYHLTRQNPAGRVGLLAVTFKPGDWRAFQNLGNTWAVITDPQEAAAALGWLRETMRQRALTGQAAPALFLFLDDLLNLLAVVPDVGALLGEVASLGRAAGIHLVIGTQRLGERGAGGAAVTGNIPGRLVFGTADAQDAAYYTGRADTGAERLGTYPGDALLIGDGGAQRLAVAYVSDHDLAGLPANGAEVRPWANRLEPVTAPAGVIGAATPAADPPAGGANRLAWRAPTAAERAELRALYARLGSKNATLRAAWGSKNGQNLAWLDQALEEVTL
jgi:hypothetical protein